MSESLWYPTRQHPWKDAEVHWEVSPGACQGFNPEWSQDQLWPVWGGSPGFIWALWRAQRVIKLINILWFKRRAIIIFELGLRGTHFSPLRFKPLTVSGSTSGWCCMWQFPNFPVPLWLMQRCWVMVNAGVPTVFCMNFVQWRWPGAWAETGCAAWGLPAQGCSLWCRDESRKSFKKQEQKKRTRHLQGEAEQTPVMYSQAWHGVAACHEPCPRGPLGLWYWL